MKWITVLSILTVAPLSTLGQNPFITQQPTNNTVVLGQPATFSVSVTGATSYAWFRDGVRIAGATGSSYTWTPALTDDGHIYQGSGNSATGSVLSNGAWLHVTPRLDIPTVTSVENFGVAPATTVADSFGLGVDSYLDWEYAAVAAMGGKWIRADGCQWEHIEVQMMPSNTSGGFAPSNRSDCLAEVSSASRYNLHLDALSYYAPPSAPVATITVSANVPAGSASIPFSIASGTLSGYAPRTMLIYGTNALNQRIDGGAPVDSISGNSLLLPEGANAAIASGTVLTINALLYPPALIPPQSSATSFVANGSVQAWLDYIKAVENFLFAYGVTGTVELNNEPENASQLWDFPTGYYTSAPANFNIGHTGRALAVAASSLPVVPGVKLLGGWTDISGDQSLFNTSTLANLPVSAAILKNVFLGESMHPYGNNPEQSAWLPNVIVADAQSGNENPVAETPIGGQVGANFKLIPFYNQSSAASGGVKASISESGLAMLTGVTEAQRTRFNLRQFLTYAGLGVYPIIFYKAGNDSLYEWFGEDAAHTPHAVVASFTKLMTDIDAVGGKSSSSSPATTLPQITSYNGYYPLATVTMTGTQSGQSSNSLLFFSWQKTFTVPPGGGNSENYGTNGNGISAMPAWTSLSSPAAVPVTVSIPTSYSVTSVEDLVTLSSVAFRVSGSSLTYEIADDPVEVFLSPNTTPVPASQTISFSSLPATTTYGNAPLGLSAVASSGLPVSYTVSGPATLKGSFLSFTGQGTVTVTANQSGNTIYSAAAPAVQKILVSPATLTVAVSGTYSRYFNQPNPQFTYTVGPFVNGDTAITATIGAPSLSSTAGLQSPAGLYPVVISAGTLTAANYTLNFVNGQLKVIGGAAQTITFQKLGKLIAVGSHLSLDATASSGLPVVLKVTSGPATITSGAILNVLGKGQISVTATQNGNSNFSAAKPISQTFVSYQSLSRPKKK